MTSAAARLDCSDPLVRAPGRHDPATLDDGPRIGWVQCRRGEGVILVEQYEVGDVAYDRSESGRPLRCNDHARGDCHSLLGCPHVSVIVTVPGRL